jgi:hypothetical protein
LIRKREDNHSADDLEPIHELGLVWPSEIQGSATLDCDPGELGCRVLRISLPGSGESPRLRPVERAATEGLARMHHARGLLATGGSTFSFAGEMEPHRLLRLHRWGGLLRIPILAVLSGRERRSRLFPRPDPQQSDVKRVSNEVP